MCDMNHSYVCDMTHSYVSHARHPCVTAEEEKGELEESKILKGDRVMSQITGDGRAVGLLWLVGSMKL